MATIHHILFAPFADSARQEQYEAVHRALQADDEASTTLLAGNILGEEASVGIDAVVVQPGSMTLLVLVPQSGHLYIPALNPSVWQLNGQPLLGFGDAHNPFAFYQQQKTVLLTWLSAKLNLAPADLPPLSGMVVFVAPVTYDPGVEKYVSHQPEAHDFQLVSDPRQLPKRLRQLSRPAACPHEADLVDWVARLAPEPLAAEPFFVENDNTPAPGFWEQKAHKLWLWLGAADVPADPPYGSAADSEQLKTLRRELQAELQQQQQAAEVRDTAREQELLQLRQHLNQTPPNHAGTQHERMALDEALRAARAESAARNQELDARIQQLGQLIEQLRTQAVAPPVIRQPLSTGTYKSAGTRTAPPRKLPGSAPASLPVRQRRLVLAGVAAAVLLSLCLGTWRLMQLKPALPKPKREQAAVFSPVPYSDETNEEASDSSSSSDTAPSDADEEPMLIQDEQPVEENPNLIMQVPSDSAARAAEQEQVEAAPPADSITP
jgi:hypothetical protein